jgi:ribA/ribD-fused uncharacterized protein
MKENDPKKQKSMGNKVKNYNQNEWKEKAKELLLPGLTAKFLQCEQSKRMLLKTGERKIVEGNPHDLFLGANFADYKVSFQRQAL